MSAPRRHRSLALLSIGLCIGLTGPAALAAPSGTAASGATNLTGASGKSSAQQGVSAPRAVRALVSRMSTEEKVGQLFVQHVYGGAADTPDPRNVPLYGVAKPSEVVAKYHLGGVIYFAWTDNLTDPHQIAGLSNGLQRSAVGSGAGVPLQIATDQEQGPVVRLGPPATGLPGAMALGAGRSTKDARRAAAITGKELKSVGINVDYAPDADVNVNPANPVIGVRSFSSDPRLVSSMVSAQVAGFQKDARVTSTVKHFPGHGDTAVDSHTGLPVITHSRAEWSRLDAPPFRAAIKAGVDQVMSAHLVVPALDPSGDPATLSKPIINGVLRGELGYRGVVVTDSLAMEGVRTKYGDGEVAVKAIEAGVDQLLMAPKMELAYNSVLQAIRTGRISQERLNESVTRVLALKWKRGVFARPYVDPTRIDRVMGNPAHRAQAESMADRGITLVANDDAALPISPAGRRTFVTGYGPDAVATLDEELARRGARTTSLVTGAAPTAEKITEAVTKAEGARTIVVTTMNASTKANASQRDLVAALQKTGAQVVVVAVRNPYDINVLPGVRTFLAAYSYNPVSARAAARVILGETKPTGRLPVSIPTADGTGVLYPFGHGLR